MKTENLKSSNLGKTSIIAVERDENNNIFVDARKLHQKLNVSTKFTMWIERRIEEYGFEEGLEFFPNLGKTSKGSKGGRPTLEYQLSISMAQELCILDNSEIGKSIRLYLLQLLNEKNNPLSTLNDLPFLTVHGRKMYCYRAVQRMLGFSVKSSINNVRRRYASQLYIFERIAYVTEEYVRLMFSRAAVRNEVNMCIKAPAVVTNQLALF
jgi:phage anti-repressor protein